MSKPKKKLVFYVDTECSFSNQGICSYYSTKHVQKQVGDNAKKIWRRDCCPIVYVKTGRKMFAAFCPTRGGAWGEQLPTQAGPGASAVRIELQPKVDKPWAEIIEEAAKTACEKRS